MLRERPLNKRLVLDSACPSTKEGGEEESCEEKVGGRISSCVLVSLRMNVNFGGGSNSGAGGASLFSTLSFFLSRSRIGILARGKIIGCVEELVLRRRVVGGAFCSLVRLQ